MIVAARPGCGKTTIGLQIAINTSKAGIPAVFWSCEMKAQELAERAICNEASINSAAMRARKLSNGQIEEVKYARQNLKPGLCIVHDQTTTIPRLRAHLRRKKRKGKLGLAIIDYIGLMSAPNAESRVQEVSLLSRQLKALAQELCIPIIVLSQLNRTTETSERPQLWHLKESGSLEQDADQVLLLWTEKEGSTIEANLAKNRGGETRMVKLSFLRQYFRVSDLQWNKPAEIYS